MLFALWYSYWVMFAGGSVTLVPPGLALITRSAYLSRSFIKLGFFILAAAIFLWISLISATSWDRAALRAFQVLLFLALTKHLLAGVSEIRVSWIPLYPAIIQHMAGRYMRVILERLEDIYYSARVTLTRGKQSRIKVLVSAVVSAMAEFVILANQEFMIISARGNLTHPKQWKIASGRNAYYVIGDATLLVLVILLASCEPGYIPRIPQTVKALSETISSSALSR